MTTSDKLREIVRIRFLELFERNPSKEEAKWIKNIASDLTALISEGYVEKAKYDEAVRQRDKLREALADMVWQFAYRGTYEGRENLHTGGLSALESAFDALGLSDPITVLDFEAAIKNTEG